MDYIELKLETEINLSQGKHCRLGVCDTACLHRTNSSCQAGGSSHGEHAPVSTSIFNSAQVLPKACRTGLDLDKP